MYGLPQCFRCFTGPPQIKLLAPSLGKSISQAFSVDDLTERYKAHDERMHYNFRDGRNDERNRGLQMYSATVFGSICDFGKTGAIRGEQEWSRHGLSTCMVPDSTAVSPVALFFSAPLS